MSYRQSITNTILSLPMTLLVKSTAIPKDYSGDTNQTIIYVLPSSSRVDLLVLKNKAKALGLPDPTEVIEIANKQYPRTVFIDFDAFAIARNSLKHSDAIPYFTDLLELHKSHQNLDVQLLPVSILWGRKPIHHFTKQPRNPLSRRINKLNAVIKFGRDCMVNFSPTVSLRYMADYHGADTEIGHKLARVARLHFARQKLAASGPALQERDKVIKRLLQSHVIRDTLREEAVKRNVSHEVVQQEAFDILDEIAANFSYSLVKKADKGLSWLWNRIYKGIQVSNAGVVRQLAQDGHEIIYVPCHRSHIDYLLLSYVLFNEGLVPPHIAAGINLNFFPVGSLFRRGGAFFLRRSFRGNRLYSVIFKEYLADLFVHGYPVEFFSEGGRSRTGRLLPAKTGMLAMTVQAMLKGLNRPVTLVPVYIGYEHVLEVSTYAKELQGKRKEKESFSMVLKTFKKLKKFGRGYVNFGAPISVNQYLNQHVPEWINDINSQVSSSPQWLTPTVNRIADKMMTHINDAAAVNAMNLCSITLLASKQRALSRESLVEQLSCYLDLLKNIPYSETFTWPDKSADDLVNNALELEKFAVEKDDIGELIVLNRQESVLATYYRNNIIHLFILPALMAQLILTHRKLEKEELVEMVTLLIPFIKNELFLNINQAEASTYIENYLNELERQGLILVQDDNIQLNSAKSHTLTLLGRIAEDTIQRYAIISHLLCTETGVSLDKLQEHAQQIARRLSRVYGINSPEFFDKKIFLAITRTIREQGYIHNTEKSEKLKALLLNCLPPEVTIAVEEASVE